MERWQYNPDIDYIAAIELYNEFVNNGNNDEAKAVAKKYGGLIQLVFNASKQKEARGNN